MTKSESKFLNHPPTWKELELKWGEYAEMLNEQSLRSLPIGTLIEYRVGQTNSFLALVISQHKEWTQLRAFFASHENLYRDEGDSIFICGCYPFAILKRGPQ